MSEENQIPSKKTILIFGISSFVGSSLAEFLRKDYRVVGTYHKNRVTIPGILTLPCDVLVKDEVQLVMFTFKPDLVIYAAGLSSAVNCALMPEYAEAINTSGVFNVTEYCQRYKAQICYISNNYVFSGENKKYFEVDIPDANNILGKTKASAEFYIQKTSLNYIIFRCANFYGRGINPLRPTWFEAMERDISLGVNCKMDDSLVTGFLDVTYLGLIIKLCFEKKVTNRLFQVSSTDYLSYYEFAKTYADVFGTGDSSISKSSWTFPITQSYASHEADKLYFQLETGNLEGFMGVQLPTVRESLEYTFKRFNGKSEIAKSSNKSGVGITFI